MHDVAGPTASQCRRTTEGGSHMSERARHGFSMAMAVAVGLSLTVSSVSAQTPPANKLQLKCQTSVSKALVKFVQRKAKCAQKCLAKARKTSGPYQGCEPPDFTDPKTNACIFDPEKGAEAKARTTISKGCAAECPVCYEFICPDGAQVVAGLEELIDSIGVQFFCLEVAGQTPTKQKAKC